MFWNSLDDFIAKLVQVLHYYFKNYQYRDWLSRETYIDIDVLEEQGKTMDKDTYPVNAMGTSKSMMEKVIVVKSRTMKKEDLRYTLWKCHMLLWFSYPILY